MTRPKRTGTQAPVPSLLSAATDWVNAYGYPLEYEASRVFRDAGFAVARGAHVLDNGKALEVDVSAYVAFELPGTLFQLRLVVECKKLSGDRAWVVFCDEDATLAPSIALSTTIASSLGEAALYSLERDPEALQLPFFQDLVPHAFGGAEYKRNGRGEPLADAERGDRVYTAMSLVARKAHLMSMTLDEPERKPQEFPALGGICFPVIVLDGPLYQATYSAEEGRIALAPAPVLRVSWLGYGGRSVYTRIDITTRDNLPAYARASAANMRGLAGLVRRGARVAGHCFGDLSLEPLGDGKDSARLPALFRQLATFANSRTLPTSLDPERVHAARRWQATSADPRWG